jgi:hypothetical protein
MSPLCYNGVEIVLQWCHYGVSVVLSWCYIQGCLLLVGEVLECYSGVTTVL